MIIHRYGFISDHTKSHNYNVAAALSSILALPFLSKPISSSCHNLCTNTQPPANFTSLLNLGLSYCLRDKRTINNIQITAMDVRLRVEDIFDGILV